MLVKLIAVCSDDKYGPSVLHGCVGWFRNIPASVGGRQVSDMR